MKKTLLVAALLVLPMVAGAFLFRMGTENEPMEVICVKEKLTDPLTLNPTAGFATHRFPSISSTYIIKVRRVVANDEVDVYDFQKNTNYYRLTAIGEWIGGSGETFYVHTWYDQTGKNHFVEQTTNIQQPKLLLNNFDGWPTLDYDGIDDCLISDVGLTTNDYINSDKAALISYGAFVGAPNSANQVYWLDALICEVGGPIGIYRGIYPVAGNDKIWFLNNDGDDDIFDAVYSVNKWYVLSVDHQKNVLIAYKDGVNMGNVASGDTAFLGNPLSLGGGSVCANCKQKIVLMFDSVLASANHSSISDYCKKH